MSDSTVILDAEGIQRTITRIAHEIAERNLQSFDVALVAIQTGGVHLAARLGKLLEEIWRHPVPTGLLDVNMHRDDHVQRPNPRVHPTTIPFNIDEKVIVLVDDVLFSGRTTRAALDSLNDIGRARIIQLAVLIDRGHRELPIKATFVGKNVPTSLRERVSVHWSEDGGTDRVCIEKP